MGLDAIVIKGAKVHNLKNIDLRIPRDKLVVITGLSGSGKSSLAFDTIYAEGQRRYVKSLSSYARQFLEQIGKPDVEYIEGLSPAISIEQRKVAKNPRSTVGTQTEIYDYLRLLFAKIGKPHCYRCGMEIRKQSVDVIIDQINSLPLGTKVQILAPIVRGRKGEYKQVFEQVRREGYVRVRVDSVIYDLSDISTLEKNKRHDIEVVIDRLSIKKDVTTRLADSVETALRLGSGRVIVSINGKSELLFSEDLSCLNCGITYEELSPRMFSFNSPYGACSACGGLGIELREKSDYEMDEIASLLSEAPCRECNGARLKKESLSVTIANKTIFDISRLSIKGAKEFFENLKLSPHQEDIACEVLKEIRARLDFLIDVGLDYLTLDRRSETLSGGETQRIRLATQIGSGLMGVLYILDEPSIGLHQRDIKRLLNTLCKLRDLGNTLIVVEHDEATIRHSDYVIDLGPGAGEDGGYVIFSGTPLELINNSNSLTGRYLKGELKISVPRHRRNGQNRFLEIIGAKKHNLKNIRVSIPLQRFVCITGVSGSGKSTLMKEILYPALQHHLSRRTNPRPSGYERITGLQYIDRVIIVDQSPIGRTPKSNPSTYTGVFTHIRQLFSQIPESKIRGYRPGRFSFNVKGGRCEACLGDGIIKIEMHFLPDVYVRCEVCKGKRYNQETLEVKYKGKNIAQVLSMSVAEAKRFFKNIPAIFRYLETLDDVGLGYIKLGQPAPTLSSGEAQRIKLASELSKTKTCRTLYLLDEPTTGLHFADVQRLLDVLFRLVDNGNTVVVIEHNMDVIKTADYIIDLGPEGGEKGGEIVAVGTPEEVKMNDSSYTGQFLTKVLGG
ncbi:MAG: excinuclease ABC subunit UvrA [bacterium]|nr:excinuclease ABC subunit UvrA [bacterium]